MSKKRGSRGMMQTKREKKNDREKILFQITATYHKEESNQSVGFFVGDSTVA